MDLYITRNGKQLGPYSLDEANKNLRGGVIDSSDLAWHAGLSEWVPLSTVPGIMASPPPPPRRAQPPPPVPTGSHMNRDTGVPASPKKYDGHEYLATKIVLPAIILVIYFLIHGCHSNKPMQFVNPYPVRNQ